jgi:hypothetical protein
MLYKVYNVKRHRVTLTDVKRHELFQLIVDEDPLEAGLPDVALFRRRLVEDALPGDPEPEWVREEEWSPSVPPPCIFDGAAPTDADWFAYLEDGFNYWEHMMRDGSEMPPADD